MTRFYHAQSMSRSEKMAVPVPESVPLKNRNGVPFLGQNSNFQVDPFLANHKRAIFSNFMIKSFWLILGQFCLIFDKNVANIFPFLLVPEKVGTPFRSSFRSFSQKVGTPAFENLKALCGFRGKSA